MVSGASGGGGQLNGGRTFSSETRSDVSSSVSPEIWSTIPESLGSAAAVVVDEAHRRGDTVGTSLSAGAATADLARRAQHRDARAIAEEQSL